jgi:hypothetical protein
MQVGFDDFGKVIANNLNFVDKTLFIKEVLDNKNTEVSVITRPRRFGKTFNMSMLHYFLAPEVNQKKTEKLFDGLKISTIDNCSYVQHQGKFPVVFISFKGINASSYDLIYSQLYTLIINVFNEHSYLEKSDKLTESDKEKFQSILDKQADNAVVEDSLRFLTSLLFKYFGIKPWLLIDEYDTPIQSGYSNNYYDEIINLMRRVLGAALKTNQYLERAVITGILRVAKESIFSDLNNVKVYSLLHPKYGQYFGFTEEEVADLLKQAGLEERASDIKRWYNGYLFGNTVVYNPWSIANCIQENGKLQPYWANTSENTLIKKLLIQSPALFKEQFECLLQDQPIEKIVDDSMVFEDLENNTAAVWNLLIMTGYLKATTIAETEQGTKCQVEIPNIEIRSLYRKIIEQWLGNGRGVEWYNQFLEFLLHGNIEKFSESLEQVLIQTISVHDTAKKPEVFFHGFMLGLTASLSKKEYEIKSNQESGYGRYDIAILPKDISKSAVILELKSITPPKVPKKSLDRVLDSLLTREAQKALEQIDKQQYVVGVKQRGFADVIKIGLAFCGKNFKVLGSRR